MSSSTKLQKNHLYQYKTYVYDNSHATLPFKRIVCVKSEGYETLYYDLNILPSEAKHSEVAHNIGVIRLHREMNRKLDEVVVTASRIMMVMKGDTLVYDANVFQLSEGSMLDELIKQLPGVRLESGGRITVNGHFVSSLLVNGKDFFSGDPKVALQNLPAYMVNKVKAYQKTPDDAYLTRSPDEKGPRMDDPLGAGCGPEATVCTELYCQCRAGPFDISNKANVGTSVWAALFRQIADSPLCHGK